MATKSSIKVSFKANKNVKPIDDSKLRELKAEISRKASMANKRLQRLEKNNLTSLPAYRNFVEYGGGVKFSVRGKNYNELQKELSRVNHFIDAKTSTVRGATRVLKDMASTAGIDYKSTKELMSKTNAFFQLASQVEQYLEVTNNAGQAIGYQKIWQVINEYVEREDKDLVSGYDEIVDSIDEIAQLTASAYANQVIPEWVNDLENLF